MLDNRWHPLAKMIVYVMREEIKRLLQEMQTTKIEKRYMTVKELVVFADFSEVAIYRKVSRRQIPFIRMGRKIMFDREAIIDWMRENSL